MLLFSEWTVDLLSSSTLYEETVISPYLLCNNVAGIKHTLRVFLVVFEQVCTAKMNLGDEVDLEDYVSRPDKISAAEVCFLGSVTFCSIHSKSPTVSPTS